MEPELSHAPPARGAASVTASLAALSDESRGSTAYASRHQAAEQRRRTRINERLDLLRKLVPHTERANTAAFLEEVVAYVDLTKRRVLELEGALQAATQRLIANGRAAGDLRAAFPAADQHPHPHSSQQQQQQQQQHPQQQQQQQHPQQHPLFSQLQQQQQQQQQQGGGGGGGSGSAGLSSGSVGGHLTLAAVAPLSYHSGGTSGGGGVHPDDLLLGGVPNLRPQPPQHALFHHAPLPLPLPKPYQASYHDDAPPLPRRGDHGGAAGGGGGGRTSSLSLSMLGPPPALHMGSYGGGGSSGGGGSGPPLPGHSSGLGLPHNGSGSERDSPPAGQQPPSQLQQQHHHHHHTQQHLHVSLGHPAAAGGAGAGAGGRLSRSPVSSDDSGVPPKKRKVLVL